MSNHLQGGRKDSRHAEVEEILATIRRVVTQTGDEDPNMPPDAANSSDVLDLTERVIESDLLPLTAAGRAETRDRSSELPDTRSRIGGSDAAPEPYEPYEPYGASEHETEQDGTAEADSYRPVPSHEVGLVDWARDGEPEADDFGDERSDMAGYMPGQSPATSGVEVLSDEPSPIVNYRVLSESEAMQAAPYATAETSDLVDPVGDPASDPVAMETSSRPSEPTPEVEAEHWHGGQEPAPETIAHPSADQEPHYRSDHDQRGVDVGGQDQGPLHVDVPSHSTRFDAERGPQTIDLAQLDDLDGPLAEIMRPMIREWLDQALPRIVEKVVREEIAKLGRKG